MKWLNAEEEFESWWQGKNNFAYHFEDARAVMGVLKTRKVIVQGRPSDYLVTSNGVTFYAEVKSCADFVSFPLSNVRKEQWRCCIRVTAAKGLYYFFIKAEETGQWYRVPGAFMVHLFDAGVKSFKWSQIEEYKWTGLM